MTVWTWDVLVVAVRSARVVQEAPSVEASIR
ncbi:hypothetical protein ABH935_009700 [Catenulispora sp. GAS73]